MLMIQEIANNNREKSFGISVSSIYLAHTNFNIHHFIMSEVHFSLTL
jgi:hypothetical protein